MNKKSDDNLDKNSQKQTVHFVYDEKQKFLWIDKYYFRYFVGYALGVPYFTYKAGCFEAVKNKSELNFFGLEERQYKEITERQINQLQILYLLGVIPFFIGFFIFLIVFLIVLLLPLSQFFEFFTFFPKFFIPLIIMIFFVLVMELIYLRLLVRIMEYLTPEAICIIQIINLNLELTRDDVIYRRDVKSMILFRMEYLARVTMLISFHYGIGKSSNQKWIQKHFQNISYYIRERRRWLIAPNETTLDDLRRDFRKLAYYYLTGKYGAWEWQSFEFPTEVVKQTRFQKIQGNLVRFFGITLPLLIMAFYILFPDKFPNPDAEILKNLPYIFIAWLLVSLDITLKLGVIESLTKLITGLKDLSK
jgi:hypothetical protein